MKNDDRSRGCHCSINPVLTFRRAKYFSLLDGYLKKNVKVRMRLSDKKTLMTVGASYLLAVKMSFFSRKLWIPKAVCAAIILLLLLWTFWIDSSWFINTTALVEEQNHKRIVFMETSGSGEIRLRHLIGIEAAAKWNTDKEIEVLMFTNKNVSQTKMMTSLQTTYRNIKYNYYTIEDYVRGTILEGWFKEGRWKKSASPVAHTSDGLRLLTLWRKGGIYLDLDVITIKPLRFPKNAVMPENSIPYFSSACMAFQESHPFILSSMKYFVAHYDPTSYVINGPPLIANQYKEYCVNVQTKCDIDLLPIETATPIIWNYGTELFDEKIGEVTMKKFENSSAVHWWNDLFYNKNVNPFSKCAFMILTRNNAPIVYKEILNIGHL